MVSTAVERYIEGRALMVGARVLLKGPVKAYGDFDAVCGRDIKICDFETSIYDTFGESDSSYKRKNDAI